MNMWSRGCSRALGRRGAPTATGAVPPLFLPAWDPVLKDLVLNGNTTH